MKITDYPARPVFVIGDGTTEAEAEAHLASHLVRQPAHIVWCDACNCYRREAHECADPPPGCPEEEA